MQALQVSGQAAEIRDPFPASGPVAGELNNSEHPFMKLLRSLRNTMNQEGEQEQGALETVEMPRPDSSAKGKSMTDPGNLNASGFDKAERGLPGDVGLGRDAGLVARNALVRFPDEAGPKASQGSRDSNRKDAVGKSLSTLLGGKAAPNPGNGNSGETVKESGHGEDSGAVAEGPLFQNALQNEQRKLPGLGDKKLESTDMRNTDNALEALGRRRAVGIADGLKGTVLAASGNVNGAVNTAGLNRNQNLGAGHDKGDSTNAVDATRNPERRPSRYSVVDLRLKAATGKASQEAQTEGKSGGKEAGPTGPDSSRSGFSGIDGAGRTLGNDQQSAGFAELSRGSGNEGSEKAPASFADNLAARLRDGGSMDIVRSAQIVLKDGDAGLIRLRLEPESLGGVKIELKMADKQISARIIVASDLAGEAFRSSLDSLRDAFASSGFETTSIEVEVRDGRAGTGDTGRNDSGSDKYGDSQDLYAARKVGELGDAVPSADARYGRFGVIDLVV